MPELPTQFPMGRHPHIRLRPHRCGGEDAGRRPAVEGLGLSDPPARESAAGIAADKKAFLFRTSRGHGGNVLGRSGQMSGWYYTDPRMSCDTLGNNLPETRRVVPIGTWGRDIFGCWAMSRSGGECTRPPNPLDGHPRRQLCSCLHWEQYMQQF